ncbi:hypothetical protein GCM10010435_56090 [Winogradskya consettensis]
MVGKLALLLAFVYVLVLVAALVGVAKGEGIPFVGYVVLLLPALPFVMSSREAVRLHRAGDVDQARTSLKRCAMYAGLGLVLLIVVGMALDGMS